MPLGFPRLWLKKATLKLLPSYELISLLLLVISFWLPIKKWMSFWKRKGFSKCRCFILIGDSGWVKHLLEKLIDSTCDGLRTCLSSLSPWQAGVVESGRELALHDYRWCGSGGIWNVNRPSLMQFSFRHKAAACQSLAWHDWVAEESGVTLGSAQQAAWRAIEERKGTEPSSSPHLFSPPISASHSFAKTEWERPLPAHRPWRSLGWNVDRGHC